MAPKGSGTISRYSLVEVGVASLEEVCHCGGGFEVSFAQASLQCNTKSTSCYLQDVELSATSLAHVCLHTTLSHHDDNGLNLENYKLLPQ